MIEVNVKQLATVLLLAVFLGVPNAQAEGFMGPLDMNDWSRGPICQEIDDNNPKKISVVQCADSDIRTFDSNWVVPNSFLNSHFDQLEKLYSTLLKEDARYADGISKVSVLCDALESIIRRDVKSSLSQIKKWQAESNGSFLSRYAEAAYWHAAAWSARGRGYANTVTKEGWALFRERLNKSLEIIDQLGEESRYHPAWYTLKIDAMHEAGAPVEEIRKIYLEGISRFPEYHQIYFSMGRSYSPLWGGDKESFDAFVQEVVRKTNGFEGNAFYARLYWTVDRDSEIPFRDESGRFPEWNKLKSAYNDMMKKYPDSQRNKNRFAEVTCRSSDSQLYRKLRAEIDGQFTDDLFGPGLRDRCDLKHSWRLAR